MQKECVDAGVWTVFWFVYFSPSRSKLEFQISANL
jgi:hypothetical protein